MRNGNQYAKFIQKIKDHWLVVLFVFLATVIGAIANATDQLRKIEQSMWPKYPLDGIPRTVVTIEPRTVADDLSGPIRIQFDGGVPFNVFLHHRSTIDVFGTCADGAKAGEKGDLIASSSVQFGSQLHGVTFPPSDDDPVALITENEVWNRLPILFKYVREHGFGCVSMMQYATVLEIDYDDSKNAHYQHYYEATILVGTPEPRVDIYQSNPVKFKSVKEEDDGFISDQRLSLDELGVDLEKLRVAFSQNP